MHTNANQQGNGSATLHQEPGRGAAKARNKDSGILPGTRKLAACPQCHVLYAESEGSCPACGTSLAGPAPAAKNGTSNGKRAGTKSRRRASSGKTRGAVILPAGSKQSADKSPTGKISSAESTKDSDQAGRPGVRGRLSTLGERLPSLKDSRRKRLLAVTVLAAGLAVGGYLILNNDPEAEVARKALDRSRPATVNVVSSTADSTSMTELMASGNEARTAGTTIAGQQQDVGKLESAEYRKVAGGDLASQRAVLAPYAAIATVDPRKVSSRKLRKLGRAVKEEGSQASRRLVASQAAVDRVGALAPQARRPRLTARRLEAASRRASLVLAASASEVKAWERRTEAWRKRQAARKAALEAYQKQTQAAIDRYEALRGDLQRIDENELDAMTMTEAEETLQDQHDQRVEVLDSLMAVQAPASVAGVHDQLAETVRQGIDGLDNAISAMGDQGDLTIATDYSTGEDYLFGTYFRDEPEWRNYENTSEANTERLGQLVPEWEAGVQGEQQRISSSKAPKRPTI